VTKAGREEKQVEKGALVSVEWKAALK